MKNLLAQLLKYRDKDILSQIQSCLLHYQNILINEDLTPLKIEGIECPPISKAIRDENGKIILHLLNETLYYLKLDLLCTHLNACELDFEKLNKFDEFSFLHDIRGIINCLNRETGKLENNFLPRCAIGRRQ